MKHNSVTRYIEFLSSAGSGLSVLMVHRFKTIKVVIVMRSYVLINDSCSGEVIAVVNSSFLLLSYWGRGIG